MNLFPLRASAVALSLPLAFAVGAQNLTKHDAAFLEQAAQNGHAEVESAKVAVRKASHPDVKTFAQRMSTDHTQSGETLKALAATKGVKVSTEPSIRQRAQLKLLSAMDGSNFDKRYAEQMGVEAHEETVELFKKASVETKDADVKAFAAKTLPTLEHHLMMARQLKKATGAD